MLSFPTALYVFPSLSQHDMVDSPESLWSSRSFPSESLKFDAGLLSEDVSNVISPLACRVSDMLFCGRDTIPLEVLAIHNVPSLSFRISL